MSAFPDHLIRGISNAKQYLDEEGNVSASLFYFGEKTNVPVRPDNCHEESIVWNDNENVIQETLQQKKADDSLQFEAGVVILDRSKIDLIAKVVTVSEKLSYERSPTPTNSAHGNLLLDKTVSKVAMKRIAATIATMAPIQVVRNTAV